MTPIRRAAPLHDRHEAEAGGVRVAGLEADRARIVVAQQVVGRVQRELPARARPDARVALARDRRRCAARSSRASRASPDRRRRSGCGGPARGRRRSACRSGRAAARACS